MWQIKFDQLTRITAASFAGFVPMREMIVNELTETMQEIVRSFARLLPRLAVMLVIVLV